MEYGGSSWIPLYQKDRDRLEKVQQRSTRLVTELRNKTYEERLKALDLPTLAFRKKRADVIQTFKIFKHFDKIEDIKLFQRSNYQKTRGHIFKVFKSKSKLNVRKRAYAVRVVNDWNSLPNNVVAASTVNEFKSGIAKCWSDHHLKFRPYVSEEFFIDDFGGTNELGALRLKVQGKFKVNSR